MPKGKKENGQRVVYHVTPDAAGRVWIVSQENQNFRREFDRKEDAVDFAKVWAQKAPPSQVKVHRQDGNMEYESTYGGDPRDIPG